MIPGSATLRLGVSILDFPVFLLRVTHAAFLANQAVATLTTFVQLNAEFGQLEDRLSRVSGFTEDY